jgi:hypothetical protein
MVIGWGEGWLAARFYQDLAKGMDGLPFLLPPNNNGQRGNSAIVEFDKRGKRVLG